MPLRRSRSTITMLCFALLATACSANWQPVAAPPPKPLGERAVIEFRARNQLVRLHGVQFTRDSLSGIPWLEHLSCDTCRVRYALADVTQLRTGNPGAGAWGLMLPISIVTGLGVMLAIAIAASPGWGN